VWRIGKMVEKTSQKKVVGRTVAIALGMVCIVLLAGLVGAIVVYMPMVNNLQSQMTEKDNTISSLNSQISDLNNSLNQISNSTSNKDTQIAALNSQVADLNSQISSLTNILYLNASAFLVYNQGVTQDPNASTTVFIDMLNYAGYVSVDVQSNSTTTYVEVIYSSHGVNYDNNMTVGTSGTAAFPVLRGTVEIRVGNTDTVDSVNATVTATYYY
jgi:cell division protein FtsL